MNNETYKMLKRVRKTQVPQHELKKIKSNIPIVQYALSSFIGDAKYIVNFSNIKQKFSNLEPTETYKDELVITYLLFLSKIINNYYIEHVFMKPNSMGVFHWITIYKQIVYVIIKLIYNKKFTDEDWINLEYMTHKLNEGYPDSVRNFLKQMKILTISDEYQIDMEINYNGLFIIAPEEFGPFYWRIIHFVAEAFGLRKNAELAKSIWKEFTIHLCYRTLLCGICKMHYKEVVEKYKSQLQNSSDYAKLWFDIHNDINKTTGKLEYSEKEFEKDRNVMRNLLNQK